MAFQPIDSKLAEAVAPTFLTLDDAPAFRSFGGLDTAPISALTTAADDVFRSVGPEAGVSTGGSGGIGLSIPLTVRSVAADHDSGSDDAGAAHEDDGSASAAAAFWSASAHAHTSAVPSASHQLKSLSLPAVVSAAADVEEAPVYYERHSSFLTTTAPTDVLLAVAQLLEQQCIEFAYSPNKHKIRGVVVAHGTGAGAPANFVVRVWRLSSANAFLCEFQRRSGCVVVFTNFYRAVTSSLAHLIMGAVKPKLASDFDAVLRATEPLPLPSSLASSSSSGVTLDESTYAVLSEMASSRDAVCASEAMRVLGRVVAMSPANHEFVATRLHQITVAPASSSSSSSPAAAAPAEGGPKPQPMVSSLAGAARSSNAYLQMLAVKLITTLCAATGATAAVADTAALLDLLPSAPVRTPASDLLCRETARLVRSVRGSAPTACASTRVADKLALPALSAVPAPSGKSLSLRSTFTSVNAGLDASALVSSK